LAEIKNQASAAGTLYLQAEATAKEAEVAAAQAKS